MILTDSFVVNLFTVLDAPYDLEAQMLNAKLKLFVDPLPSPRLQKTLFQSLTSWINLL